ncbi:hypothetical protein JHK87_016289 [Glycine soja]|nr:hypothetical protein JHK87_016289 [Glycine soja]
MPSVVDEEDSQKGSSGLWMWNMVKGIRIAKIIRGLLGQKDALDDMPFCGCAFGAIDGCTKLSVVVNGELYAFDPSNYVDSGRIKVYDQGEDEWKVVIGKVPVYDFTESESPYLLAGFRGKLHFITKDANHDISVLQADHCSNVDSSPSTSAPQSPKYMEDELLRESAETNEAVWKLVASKGFEQAELINCQDRGDGRSTLNRQCLSESILGFCTQNGLGFGFWRGRWENGGGGGMQSWGRWWHREEGGEMTLGRGKREREREKKKIKDDEEEAQ